MRQPRSLSGVYPPQGSFNCVEFELQKCSRHCQLADSKAMPASFLRYIPVSVGGHVKQVLAKEIHLEILRAQGKCSYRFASCLEQKCNVWSCGSLLQPWVRAEVNCRHQLRGLASLSCWVGVTSCLRSHSCHGRNTSFYLLAALLVGTTVTCSQRFP